ncbi:leucyl aminopeptidase family protein [Zymomonas sp.]|uniref:leucyl aminopeptidase family protein n=1 Tax=Zymomonas sp. TaxID=2068624 RepID=UPI0025E43F24|nr:leucyl aminopeptidase family protein [Zymomonas sp.]MCA1955353.1 leucyl aminopeptidase family protein [Zymomonas sp.]
MRLFKSLLAVDKGQPAQEIIPVTSDEFETLLAKNNADFAMAAQLAHFSGQAGESLLLPANDKQPAQILVGVSEENSIWDLAKLASLLPEGSYRLRSGNVEKLAFGWLLAQHYFDRYHSDPPARATRILFIDGDQNVIDDIVAQAEATALVRDLVDTPACDCGPAELQKAVEEIATIFQAIVTTTHGKELDSNYPMVAAVGRAAAPHRAPRLIELQWGRPEHPRIAIVGKGVCFDSGGLDIKPSSSMLLMKKDMGGAAHALALSYLIMAMKLPVRLHLVIPAVENAVSGDAMRPGDILTSRKGTTVEIGNTDAEGRLVLADALTKASEPNPELILDFATLTGAARVALGTDLPALFSNDDELAHQLAESGNKVQDPLWRLPLWADYLTLLKSSIADINNAGSGGMAGAITAALFLQEFVGDSLKWAHFDTFAWQATAKAGRPKGGAAYGLRAAWQMLKSRFIQNG